MKAFTLSVAEGTRQVEKNNRYGSKHTISCFEDLCRACMYDHVGAEYKENHRKNENFERADCIMMDCDNEKSDNPAEWLTPEKLAEILPGVAFYYVYSKSHMKDKDSLAPRPRFHVYFALSEPITSATSLRELKENLRVAVPDFDKGAKDAARFFYGVEQPQGGVHEDSLCVDEFITMNDIKAPKRHQDMSKQTITEAGNDDDVIKVGVRHDTLLTKGINLISQYGKEKARELFFKEAGRCQQPLPVDEVNDLWEWLEQKGDAFKAKYTDKKKTLTLQVIEQTLQELNISVQFNVITKELEVSDLPADSPYLPNAYYSLPASARTGANAELLPLFLESYFKDKQFRFSGDFLRNAIAALSNTHRFNPVIDLIKGTQWDGKDRIASLCRVLGIQDNGYQCAYMRKWLHQAVALAGNDDGGISSEFVMVLQGAQGIGKTNFFRRLAIRPEWFKDAIVIDMRNKDSIIESTCVWIGELGELDATLKKEQASLKGFITSNHDTYRRPYARKAEKIERRTCFCATVNPEHVNRDTTGSRRFIYIHVDNIDKQFIYEGMTPEWCTQLWQQVYQELYLPSRAGFYLTDDERAYAEKANEAFNVPLIAETELLDLIDWEECYKIDPADGTPCKVFQWYTASEVKAMLKLNRYSAEQIGAALKALCERYPYTDRKRSHGRTNYLLPPVKEIRD